MKPQEKHKWFPYLVLGLFLLTMGFAALTCILIMVEQPWKASVICNAANSSAPQLLGGINTNGQQCYELTAKEASPLLNLSINLMVGFGSALIVISIIALIRHKYARKKGIQP